MEDKKIDVGYTLRTLVCVLAFIATIIYFSFSCKALANDYSAITNMQWWGNFAIASILFIIMLKVTVVLLRPFRITIVAYALGAIVYALIIGSSGATWIASAIFFIFLSLYLLLETIQLNNQIKFSLHPLSEKKILICSLLAMLISVALGSAYYRDSIKRNYIIPPEIKTFFTEQIMNGAKTLLTGQSGREKLKQTTLKQTEEKVQAMIDDGENSLRPNQKYIPIILGIISFFCFLFVLYFLSFVPAIFIPLIFWGLKISHFTHTAIEKREIQRLTL